MTNEKLRYRASRSILNIPSGIFDIIVDFLDTGPRTKNWRALVDLANARFRLTQLEIEKISSAVNSQNGSPARQALLKLESFGLTVGDLVSYLDSMRLENLLIYFKYYEPIQITSSPEALYKVQEGGMLQLQVTATGFPYPRYQWFNDDTPVEGATENILTIKNIPSSQSGSYCCRLHNSSDLDLCVFTEPADVTVFKSEKGPSETLITRGHGEQIILNPSSIQHMDQNKAAPYSDVLLKAPAHVKLPRKDNGLPYITQHPLSLCASRGERVKLTCQAHGSDVKYRWTFNGRVIEDNKHGEMQIVSIEESDAGHYECFVYNNFGYVTSDAADVTVLQSPCLFKGLKATSPVQLDIISQPKSATIVSGGCAFYRCIAVGSPPINYQWYKDSKPIVGECRSELILSDVSSDTEACFQCRVWNDTDEILSCAAYLTVTDSDTSYIDHTVYTATDKVALLLGNYDYHLAGALKAPKTDVHVLSECFRSMNFKVVSLLNLTKSEMLAAVKEFCDLISDSQSCGSGVYVVFYFCGHGFQDHLKQTYLVPVDAPAVFSTSDCLCAEYILEQIQETHPALCCVILDCCRTLNDVPPDKTQPLFYPQPHGNTVFFYATTFGMRAFEQARDEEDIEYCEDTAVIPSEELNGILVKHLQVNLCKKQSVMSVFSATQEAINNDLLLRSCQIPDFHSNLSEPRRSLADKIIYRGHTTAYSQRMLRWLSVNNKPARSQMLIDEIDAVIEVDYQSDFSNVLSVYLKVKDKGKALECQPWVTKLPLNLDVMGHPKIVAYEPLTTKTTIQDLQKLQDPLMLTVGVYYRLADITGCHPGKTIDLGKPLVSVLDLWQIGNDIACEPLHQRDTDNTLTAT